MKGSYVFPFYVGTIGEPFILILHRMRNSPLYFCFRLMMKTRFRVDDPVFISIEIEIGRWLLFLFANLYFLLAISICNFVQESFFVEYICHGPLPLLHHTPLSDIYSESSHFATDFKYFAWNFGMHVNFGNPLNEKKLFDIQQQKWIPFWCRQHTRSRNPWPFNL